MKKLLVLLMVLVSTSFLFCQENENHSDSKNVFIYENNSYKKVSNYLGDNFSSVKLKFSDPEEITDEIDLLTDKQRAALYERYSRSSALYFGINMLTIPGLGSLIQGDKFGGTIALTTGIIGSALSIGGYVGLFTHLTYSLYNDEYDPRDFNTVFKFAPWVALMFCGGVFDLVSMIFNIVRPFTYANSLNNGLKNILKIEEAKVTLAPVINTNNTTGVCVGLALKI